MRNNTARTINSNAVPIINPIIDDNSVRDSSSSKADKEKSTTANALIALVVRYCDLFHDERGEGYAVMRIGIPRTLKLRSKEFRVWLAGQFYRTSKRAANNEALSTALTVLDAKAIYDGSLRELSNRFVLHEEAVYIDMADEQCRVLKVDAAGWAFVKNPPVFFRRYAQQLPLPDPVSGGKLSDIHTHFAIKSKYDRVLVEAWLVASMFSTVPRPVLTFHGPQGASKTTTARCLKAIIDPSLITSVDLGKSPPDLAQILDHYGVPCFDNLTAIPAWAADMLCRGVTGGAFSKRALYSDDSDVILSFKRPIMITGINIPTHAPDLLDRFLLIELERILPSRRMDETTFWQRFEAAKGKLFGALLDAIAGTLKHLPGIRLQRMSRMADFSRIACAYAEFSGFGTRKMLKIIMQHTSRLADEVLDADPVAAALASFAKNQMTWTGTATMLLKELDQLAPRQKPQGWPRRPNNLTRRINILNSTLKDSGIEIRKSKKKDKLLTIENKPNSSSASSVSSVSSETIANGNSSLDDKLCALSQASFFKDDKAEE